MKMLLFTISGLLVGLTFLGLWPTSTPASDESAVADPGDAPRELGNVQWLRGFDSAIARAKAENKPLLILFQEVPGCATCVGYGQQVLSHPLIVEAVEDLFVPLAVYNNISGEDRKTLTMFREPTWNNPVVRVIASNKEELAPRLDEDYTQYGLVKTMVTALKKAGKPVPRYLQLLSDELTMLSHNTEKATFTMYCFWTGEAELGSLDGVLSTTAGFVKGKEVVEVEFDPSIISYDELVRNAHGRECATTVFSRSARQQAIARGIVGDAAELNTTAIRPDSEPKYYLSRTLLRHLPMTQLQKARANSAIGHGDDPVTYLSPRQTKMLTYIKQHPGEGWKNVISEEDLADPWNKVMASMGG